MNENANINNKEPVEIVINNPLDNDIGNNDAPQPPKQKRPEYKKFPLWLAIIVLIVNIPLPGFGTFIATAKITDRTYISFYCFSGLCQFLTFICIIGWIFALIHSITFLSAACAHKSIEEYLATENKKSNPIAKVNGTLKMKGEDVTEPQQPQV